MHFPTFTTIVLAASISPHCTVLVRPYLPTLIFVLCRTISLILQDFALFCRTILIHCTATFLGGSGENLDSMRLTLRQFLTIKLLFKRYHIYSYIIELIETHSYALSTESSVSLLRLLRVDDLALESIHSIIRVCFHNTDCHYSL